MYSSLPPANTPITPGTQIILSEGVANGVGGGARVSINPMVSLPLHPVPQSQTESLSITRCLHEPDQIFIILYLAMVVFNCSLLQRQCCAHSEQRPHGAAPAAAHPQRVPVHGGGGGAAPGPRPARPGPGAASQEVQGGPGRPRTLRHATRDTWRRVVTTLVVN